jgi:hypothetical protein
MTYPPLVESVMEKYTILLLKKSDAIYSTRYQGTLLKKVSWKKIKQQIKSQPQIQKDDFLD